MLGLRVARLVFCWLLARRAAVRRRAEDTEQRRAELVRWCGQHGHEVVISGDEDGEALVASAAVAFYAEQVPRTNAHFDAVLTRWRRHVKLGTRIVHRIPHEH